MAHLGCPSCSQSMCAPMCDAASHWESNMNMNVKPACPSCNWTGTWHARPHGGTCSHVSHRSSRPPSPTHSVKSRKSHLSRRRRYEESEDSDDELEERRSVVSNVDRTRRGSIRERYVRKPFLRETASMPKEMEAHKVGNKVEKLVKPKVVQKAPSTSSGEHNSGEDSPDDEANELVEKIARPKISWSCEHCTFLNETSTRVCSVCCKTSSSACDGRTSKNSPSEQCSRNCSETESVTNKLEGVRLSPDVTGSFREGNPKKGRIARKISFWPGTKFSTLQK